MFNPFYGCYGCCVSKRPPIILNTEEDKFTPNLLDTEGLNLSNDDGDMKESTVMKRSQYIDLAI